MTKDQPLPTRNGLPLQALSLLVRRWFLCLIVLGIALSLLATDEVRVLVEPIPRPAVVAVTLFLMSWSLETRQLWQALFRPLPALWACAVSYGFLPILGLLASRLLALEDYRIGLLVATSVPCTLASAVIWTRLGGGNEATALLVILLTTCTSWLITSSWLVWTTGATIALDLGPMMHDLFLYLVIPVGLGQLARGPVLWRQIARRRRITLSVLAQFLIFTMIVQAVVAAADRLRSASGTGLVWSLVGVAAVCVGVHLGGLAVGFWGSKLLRMERRERIAVAFASSQKTLPVGLLLLDAHFRGYPLAVVPLLFFHVGQLFVDTFLADAFRGRSQTGPAGSP